ncbi:MAG: hypothetical protein ACTSU2_13910 [Promethearchaeota archaeon]
MKKKANNLDELEEDKRLKNALLPDEKEQDLIRERLRRNAKILKVVGWVISIVMIVGLFFYRIVRWYGIVLILAVLSLGQIIRMYGKLLEGRSNSEFTPLTPRQLKKIKQDMEKEVIEYFNSHVNVAQKVVNMKKLAERGKFNDAYNIARSIYNENLPKAVKVFLKNKMKLYKSYS